MRQIRTGVFETNSSSTHSICISTERSLPLDYPSVVHFSCKHFGWKEAKLDSPDEKASYLYASILDLFSQRDAEKIKNKIHEYLSEEDIVCEFDEPIYHTYSGMRFIDNAGIDHAGNDEHMDFVKAVLHNKKRLLRYLFSINSYVLTGNDNNDSDVSICANYPHEEYYKGN